MAYAGKSDKKENVTAAIAANIWMSHERGGRTALPDETLNYIVLDCLVSCLEGLGVGVCLALWVGVESKVKGRQWSLGGREREREKRREEMNGGIGMRDLG